MPRVTCKPRTWTLAALLLLCAGPAEALPRFAARTGMTCGTCHINPTGGGMRTDFARNVFARQWLATSTGPAADVDLGEHVAVGGDLRAGYLFLDAPRPELVDTASFALMQADLYVWAEPTPGLAFYLDKGAYGGFEAFALVRPFGRPDHRDFTIKAGRFVVPFGLRDVNHASYVREGVGFGTADRDSGVEVGLASGRTTAQVSITNGTYGDAFFDTGGTEDPRPYDLAVSGRFTTQPRLGPLRTLLEASASWNRNVAQQNPLFASALFVGDQTAQIGQGLNEQRATVGIGVALGRLEYRGELVVVRDNFRGDDLRTLWGYTSAQTLGAVVLPGLEVAATYEFADADAEFARGRVERVGASIEWFPVPGLEVSLLARRSFGNADYLIGGARHDVVAFLHLFL